MHDIVLSLDNIQFMPDKSLTIYFFGIKNDTLNSGFKGNIMANTEASIVNPFFWLTCVYNQNHIIKN